MLVESHCHQQAKRQHQQVENEREAVHWRKRQKDGIAAARARGIRFGRPTIKTPKNFEDLVTQWEQGTLLFGELLERTGLKEATFYRRLRELRKGKKK